MQTPKALVFLVAVTCLFLNLPYRVSGQIVPKDHTVPEGLFIHTDRDLFVAGEQLLFSLSLFKGNGGVRRSEGEMSRYAYLVLRSNNEMVDYQRVLLDNGSAHGGFYLEDTLSTGYYELLGFTNWMRNQDAGTFFRKHIFIANRFDEELNIPENDATATPNSSREMNHKHKTTPPGTPFRLNLSDTLFGQRRKGYVTIEAELPADHQGQLAVSITPEDSHLGHNKTFAGYLSGIEEYFDEHDPANQPFPFFMETKGMVVSGQVTDESGQPAEGSRITLSKQDTLVNLKYADACSGGLFHFLLDPYYDDSRLFFSLVPKEERSGKTIHLFDKAEVDFPFTSPPGTLYPEQRDLLISGQDLVSIQKAYRLSDHDMLEKPRANVFPPLLYAKANDAFYPDKYVALDDVYEIAFELIPSWRIRGRGDEATHIMTDATLRQRMGDTPVFFVDGVITDNILPYLELGSEDLLKIETHDFRWQHGDMYFPGIISIFTKDPATHFAALEDDYVATTTDNPAIQLRFNPPVHEKTTEKKPEKPDARQVLLWEPDIRIGGGQTVSLPFYTSDLNGRFVVTLQGISERGEPVFQQQIIEVQ